jgi:hypothetical protein
MQIELTTKSGLTLTGELKAGGSIIELRIYEPSTELAKALMEHGINFSICQKTSYQKEYIFVAILKEKVDVYHIMEE